jgi:hypothetical protein
MASKGSDAINGLAICLQANIPPFVLGSPGIGKSAITDVIASKLGKQGWLAETLLPALREPTDFAGLPVIIDGKVRLAAPEWAYRAAAGAEANGGHLVIFDEVTCAPPAVQAALLRVVLERVVGDVFLPKTVRMLMVGNPPEQAAGGWEIAAPLMNRVCRINWTLDSEAWADYMLTRRNDVAVSFGRLPETWWEEQGVGASSLVVSFVHHRSELANKPPKADADPLDPYPTPRSWDMASKLLAACMSLGLKLTDSITMDLLAGVVGQGASMEFVTWADSQDLPDPSALLRDPKSLKLPKGRGDKVYAILSSVAAEAVSQSKNDPQQWAQAWKVLAEAAHQGSLDIAASAGRTLARNRPTKEVTPPAEIALFAPLLAAINTDSR